MRSAIGVLTLLTVASQAMAADKPVDFAREVLPILSNKCFVCHGPDAKEGQPRLDSYEAAIQEVDGQRAINPQNPDQSALIARIHDRDDPMPPADAEKQLTDTERDVLTRWVKSGGKYALHWAYVPPQKVAPASAPEAKGTAAIDALIREQLQARQADFAPEADKSTLARRVALVLTGLPPEPEQLERFLADKRPDAYERLVEELLASPRYGEHQARYWLDAVRYGDTHGLHLDNRRGIYPYRDWVVFAFNNNLPLDQFILWQLAGDLLPNSTLEQRVATGFVRMNPTTAEGGAIPDEFQAKNNFDRTETLGTVLLGMSLTCARCHTHKYDPIPQTEYYRLLAFFNSTAESPLDGNAYTYGPIAQAPDNQAGWQKWARLTKERTELLESVKKPIEERWEDILSHATLGQYASITDWKISPVVAADAEKPPEDQWQPAEGLPGTSKTKIPGEGQAVWVTCRIQTKADHSVWFNLPYLSPSPTGEKRLTTSYAPSGVPLMPVWKFSGRQQPEDLSITVNNPWESLAKTKDWNQLDAKDQLRLLADVSGPLADLKLRDKAIVLLHQLEQLEATFTTTLVAQELPSPRPTQVLRRGEYNLPVGDPVQPGVFAVLGPLPKDAPNNRLGLAQWLIAREHPLVSRVLVNRLWQQVFGEALVRTPEEFGLQGEQPTHPQLLDWLAVELQDTGWDRKQLFRELVLSRTFRQSSAWRHDLEDPENRLFSRGPGYRLDAEVIRDVALWASGLLEDDRGGEGVKPYQPEGLWTALAHPASNTKDYVRDHGEKLYRRSLYLYWKRTAPHPMMTLFDAPSREASCVRRSRSNTPLQSLGLLNETQRIEMARQFAGRLIRERQTDAERLDRMFQLLACRAPSESEKTACLNLVQTLRQRYAGAEKDALALLSVGDVPRDETLNPVEQAAWTQLAVTVLASDLALLLY